MSLLKEPLIVLDTETTGIGGDWVRVWEIGAVHLGTDGQIVDTFQLYCHPEILDQRANQALAVCQMPAHRLLEGVQWEVLAGEFADWYRKCGSPKVTAYNAAFDRKMLRQSSMDPGLRWGDCLMELAMRRMGRARWPKLAEAAAFYGVVPSGAHRALADAKTAAAILVQMCLKAGRKAA